MSVSVLLALTLATVFGFVVYLHTVVRLMRVQYLLEAIASESRRAIEENFPPASAYLDVEFGRLDSSPRRLDYAGTAGVVSAIDFLSLVTLCQRKKCWLELTVGAGEYLVHGTPIALVHGAAPKASRLSVGDSFCCVTKSSRSARTSTAANARSAASASRCRRFSWQAGTSPNS